MLENISKSVIKWLGTPKSLVVHTIFFLAMFVLVLLGWEFGQMLLVLTTLLSIEAIYLALFIQMTVNKASESLEDVEEDIDIIQADEKKDDLYDQEVADALKSIETRLGKLQGDLEILKQKGLM